jgi:crossover junction endodeoxyribonuclease RuvC
MRFDRRPAPYRAAVVNWCVKNPISYDKIFTMSLTLGIDPGSYQTGYGIARIEGRDAVCVGSGVIKVARKKPKAERLLDIKNGIDKVISMFDPDDIAVESVFVARNPKSALALGESRGVVLLAAAEAGKKIFEYSPREVKRSVVGSGAADKTQVAKMVEKIFRLENSPETSDETDALAIAFCHLLRRSSKLGDIV